MAHTRNPQAVVTAKFTKGTRPPSIGSTTGVTVPTTGQIWPRGNIIR